MCGYVCEPPRTPTQRLSGRKTTNNDTVLPKRQALYFLVSSIAAILIAFAIYIANGHLDGSRGFAVSVIVGLVLLIRLAGVLALSFSLAGIASPGDPLASLRGRSGLSWRSGS